MSLMGAVMTWRLTSYLSESAVREASQETQQDLVPRVASRLTQEDLTTPMTGQRYAGFQRFMQDSILSHRTIRVRLWSSEGVVIYSDDAGEVGTSRAVEGNLAEALAGDAAANLGTEDSPELEEQGEVLEVYAPIVLPGSEEVAGALEVYEDATNLSHYLSAMRYSIFAGLGMGLAVYFVLLFVVVRSGLRAIGRLQEKEASETLAQETVRAVVAALDLRDSETEDHAARVSEMSVATAHQMGLAPSELNQIEIGALLHDVGKIGVPDKVLLKPGPLTENEWVSMRRHPDLGYRMLQDFPSLTLAAELVRAHHENFDGSGYPHGLAGEAIPLPARVFAVADAYDAMTSDRPYRRARSHRAALIELRRFAGSQFDPDVVGAFLAVADRFARPDAADAATEDSESAEDDVGAARAA